MDVKKLDMAILEARKLQGHLDELGLFVMGTPDEIGRHLEEVRRVALFKQVLLAPFVSREAAC